MGVNDNNMEASLFDDDFVPENKNEFDCTIEKAIFTNEENGYGVFGARPDSTRDNIVITGIMPQVRPGIRIHAKGEWIEHERYGEQFKCSYYEIIIPTKADGIRKYLASGIIRGIGKKSADKIVNHFGDDTLKILDADPKRIKEVPGLPKKKIDEIIEHWVIENVRRDVMVFLGTNGLPLSFADRIIDKYKSASLTMLKLNPYTLAEEINGIGFNTADALATRLGIKADDTYRIKSGIHYAMLQSIMEGNTYSTREELLSNAQSILSISIETIEPVLEQMIAPLLLEEKVDLDFVDDAGVIYTRKFYFAEKNVAQALVKLLSQKPSKKVSDDALDFDKLSNKTKISYEDTQKEAIETAVKNKVSVITGGPGTGKTTIIKGIISIFKDAKMKILLAAPTGRAAKRMSEATSMPACTIHRLLESEGETFAKDQDSQLEGDVLIVDESSMIDISLMNALVKAIPLGMRLIMVGDVDQLPSVGSGNVLRDVIDSEVIPTVRLKKIFRQEKGSRIIDNAHLVNEGKMPNLTNGLESDFFFIRKENAADIQAEIVDLVLNRLPAKYNLYPNEIQVLSPQRKTIIGVNELNNILQDKINPGEVCYQTESCQLRVSDKVMQTRNDREKGVFNGDIGVITEYKHSDERKELWSVVVKFDDKEVEYKMDELCDLDLAYATTVHKSQGSEYPIVVIPVSMAHYAMLKRNLLYTAITRAKNICILVGTEQAISAMVANNDIEKRNTKLRERLIQYSNLS